MQFMAGLVKSGDTVSNACRRLANIVMRIVLIIAGFLSLALGVIGIFLPVLPTVPFVLLAAACFSRGSKRMHRWLLRLPFAGKMVEDYQQGRGVPLKAKISALLMLWGGMITSAILISPPWWLLGILAVTAIVATVIILRLPKAIESADAPIAAIDAETTQPEK